MNTIMAWFENLPGWVKVAAYQLVAGVLTVLTIHISSWKPTAPELLTLQTAFNAVLKTIKDAIPTA